MEGPDSFDAAELALLKEIAGDIAFGLDHIRKEEQITFLAYYDPLTGLANRSLFHDRLAVMLRKAEHDGQTVALCVADLDHFTNFNDALGRECGDLLLVEFGKRLLSCASTPEHVARLGSDRFVIALPRKPAGDPLHALIEAQLDLCTAQPLGLQTVNSHIAARFGISLYPADGSDADALFRNAEAAQVAKADGERILFYGPHMTERVRERVALENRLRGALEETNSCCITSRRSMRSVSR
jgi:diguanylate cyclase (GGDEF)-like protein